MFIHRKLVLWAVGLALAPVLFAGLLATLYRPSSDSLATPVQRAIEQAPIDSSNAAVFSDSAFASLPLVSAPPEPVIGEHFPELIRLPPGAPPAVPDPRKLRALMDRGVIAYAASKSDSDRQKAAELIQTAALLGLAPARSVVARAYPQSESVRRVVPAADAIRYAADFFTTSEIDSDDAQTIFVTLARHFAGESHVELFVTGFLERVRGDTRPQLSHRIDVVLELLSGVPGACGALARAVAAASKTDVCEAALAEGLRRYVEAGRSAEREGDLRRRGLIMLEQTGSR